MARSVNTIYNQIIAEKTNHSSLDGLAPENENASLLLNDLTSNSKVAIWRLWAYTIAVVIHTHEMIWDVFKADILQIAESAPAGTPRWYQKQMFAFQFGDLLEYINNQFVYAVIDPVKQIISRCAVEERADGVVVVKVVKDDNGTPVKLDAAELNAVRSYAHKIKFAGTRLGVVSINPDKVNPKYDIYYDPIIPLTTVRDNVSEKIQFHLANLDFNAAFNVTSFTDQLQLAEGVIDPVFKEATIENGAGVSTFDVEVIPASGYFILGTDENLLFNFIQKL